VRIEIKLIVLSKISFNALNVSIKKTPDIQASKTILKRGLWSFKIGTIPMGLKT